MILNEYLTLWQCDNLNLGSSTQDMPDFSRDVSTFCSIFVGWRSQPMCSCLQGDYDLMNNRSQFYRMCEYVYVVWHVRNVGNSFIHPSMKAYEKSLSKNRQFFKTLQSLQTLLASFPGADNFLEFTSTLVRQLGGIWFLTSLMLRLQIGWTGAHWKSDGKCSDSNQDSEHISHITGLLIFYRK